jgi:hypothetical protein
LGGVPTSRQLTINGTTYDLSADRSWTISGTSPLTTKGDIYTFDTVDARLPVGLDTQVLVADSSTATGLKWATNTTPTPTGYYAQYQDVLTQTIAVINTGYPVKFRTMDLSNGVTVVSDSRITFANTGVYNLQFSLQLENSDTQEHDVTIWLRKNGADVAGTSGFVAVVAKHGGINGHTITSWNYLLSVVGGEYYELVWSATSTQVTMPFIPAGSPPPSTASAIFTVTQQAGIMAGTGITAINSLTGAVQTLANGTSGTAPAFSSTGTTHTLNIPLANTASVTAGLLSKAEYDTFNGKADLASPTFTGTPAAPTATSGTNTTQIATTAFVQAAISGTSKITAFALQHTGAGLTAGQTQYTSFYGSGAYSGTQTTRYSVVGVTGALSTMYFYISTAQPASGSLVITLFKSNVATTAVLTIPAGSAAGVYSLTGINLSILATDLLNFRVVNNSATTSAAIFNAVSTILT